MWRMQELFLLFGGVFCNCNVKNSSCFCQIYMAYCLHGISSESIKSINLQRKGSKMDKFKNTSLANATGKIDYPLTNDYMFRAVLQENEKVLRGLVCSLLHLKPQDVKSAIITNPIVIGKYPDDKTFILDVNVLLNNEKIINLEMQVLNHDFWTNRSLSYLCSLFNNLELCFIQNIRLIHIRPPHPCPFKRLIHAPFLDISMVAAHKHFRHFFAMPYFRARILRVLQ